MLEEIGAVVTGSFLRGAALGLVLWVMWAGLYEILKRRRDG
jgi:hypothetical protein